MLEVLLFQYQDMFSEPFPLALLKDSTEADVINILYDCVSNNVRYDPEREIERKIMDAPGMKKN